MANQFVGSQKWITLADFIMNFQRKMTDEVEQERSRISLLSLDLQEHDEAGEVKEAEDGCEGSSGEG